MRYVRSMGVALNQEKTLLPNETAAAIDAMQAQALAVMKVTLERKS